MNETPAERFRRVVDLFERVVDLPEKERENLLATGDPEIAYEVRRLLEQDRAAGETEVDLESSIIDTLEEVAAEGQRFGPYRLVRKLGEGGMGVVFEAHQEQPLRRRVALKLVRGGASSARIVKRFAAERGTLARMSHPGVAQIFDAGSTSDGRPFLVMELVEGDPITTFCDSERLTTGERIRLFRQVCEAVQHAHQKGVLHRDLKPSNVLVSAAAGTPRVKVIDFGIAKLTDGGVTPGLTRHGEIVGTPEYMSPEQTRGGDVDTRSDVYSLGVVLYELLTGSVPIDRESLDSVSPVEAARLVEELPPTPPQARITPGDPPSEEIAALRRSEAKRLQRELRGDLGEILLMALRKEPERRYASVEQFSTDLANYLDGRPVLARPDSLAYRASKVIRRHTAAFVAAGLLVVGLAFAAVFSTGMYLEAAAARRESEVQRLAAEQINDFLKEMLGSIDPDLARGRDVSLLREVLDSAAGKIDSELASQPRIAADLGLTVGRVYQSIGSEDRAEERLRASLALLSEPEGAHTDTVAELELALGALLSLRDRHQEAEALLRSSVDRRRSERPRDEQSLAVSLAALAEHMETVGEYDEAGMLYREALDIQRRQPAPEVDALATTLRGFGLYLLNQRRMAEAEAPLREAVALCREAGSGNASLILPLLALSRWFQWSDRYEEAVEPVREAVGIARRHLPEDHPVRLEAISHLANVEQHRKEYGTAEELYREALDAQRRVHGARHSSSATTANNLGSLLYEIGRFDEAERLFDEATLGYVENLGADHYWASITRFNRARALFGLGRLADAEHELVEARRIRRAHESAAWQEAEVDVLLAACRVERGEVGDAEAVITRGVEAIREHYGEDTDRDDFGLRALLRIYERQGRSADAEALRVGEGLAPSRVSD